MLPPNDTNNGIDRYGLSHWAGIERGKQFLRDNYGDPTAAHDQAYNLRVERNWESLSAEGKILREAENYLWAYKVVYEGNDHWYGSSLSWITNAYTVPLWQAYTAYENARGRKLHSPVSFDAMAAGYQGGWDGYKARKME